MMAFFRLGLSGFIEIDNQMQFEAKEPASVCFPAKPSPPKDDIGICLIVTSEVISTFDEMNNIYLFHQY